MGQHAPATGIARSPSIGSRGDRIAMNTQSIEARLNAVMNDGMLSVLIGIGYELGLFEAMSGLAPSRSESIAEVAGLNERYVREWLGAMVTSGIIEHDATDGSYRLPAEHAASLTRDACPNNIAATCQWIPVLGNVEDDIVECFERGGGVPYSRFERFHAVMAEESDQSVVAVLLDQILHDVVHRFHSIRVPF